MLAQKNVPETERSHFQMSVLHTFLQMYELQIYKICDVMYRHTYLVILFLLIHF